MKLPPPASPISPEPESSWLLLGLGTGADKASLMLFGVKTFKASQGSSNLWDLRFPFFT